MRRSAAISSCLICFLAVLLAVCVVPSAHAQTSATAKSRERFLPLEVTVNSTPVGSWALLDKDGVLYAPAAAFEEWRLNRRPDVAAVSFRDEAWYPLSSIPGFDARFNYANQSVDLVFSPAAFAATRLTADEAPRAKLDPVLPALFVNYDLNYNYAHASSTGAAQELGALTEFGYSNGLGILTSSFVGRNLTQSDTSLPRTVRRLETTFTRDLPENNLTLRVGDSATRPSLLGRSFYFGGVQLSRNFGLTPGFLTQPIPVVSGTSSSPSTVELYVNDALRQTTQVPTGPFVIDNQPLTGAGDARMVVRDVLGRETVIVQPFFSHASLLAKGLNDWSVETGAPRLRLGTENADYGEGFVSGLYRQGMSQVTTVEVFGQAADRMQTGGVALLSALPLQSLGTVGVAASNGSGEGTGVQTVLGLERTTIHHSVTANMRTATRDFRVLGLGEGNLPNHREWNAGYAYNDERLGHFAVAFARLETYDRGSFNTASGNYGFNLGAGGAVNLNVTHVTGSSSGTAVGITLTVPLDRQTNLSAAAVSRAGKTDAYVRATKALGAENGLGWSALAGVRADEGYSEGGLYYQATNMLLTAEASAASRKQAMRLGAQGGLAYVDGGLWASRKLDGSFAVVEVAGYPNVGIAVHSALLTQTDADGKALVPRLMPYQANSIRLDPSELPINAEIDSIEQTATPRLRSAVKVSFPVRSGRGALIKIVLDDGEPAPAGAEIELLGDKQEFFVARRGEAFVTGLQATNKLRLKWRGASCGIQVDLPKGEMDQIARVGPLTCSGVAR